MSTNKRNFDLAFGKRNYQMLIAGFVVIIIGFILMIGGKPEDPNVFTPDMFNTTRLTVAPLMVLAGFIIEIFAIMHKSKD